MRKFYLFLYLPIIFMLISGCVSQENKKGVYMHLKAGDFVESMNKQKAGDFVLLDVRTKQEFEAARLTGSVMLDFYGPTFKTELGNLDKNKAYYIYCRSGNRSGQTLQIMKGLGFKELYNLTGGITTNTRLLPVEK